MERSRTCASTASDSSRTPAPCSGTSASTRVGERASGAAVGAGAGVGEGTWEEE